MSDREDAVGSGGMLIILVHEFLAGMFVAINCVLKYHPILRRRLSLFFLIALFVLNAAFSQPKIVVVEGTQFDFGKIDQGETITKKLTLKNTGNDTLRISNVSTSCGCTVARLSTKLLVPGDSALLTIAFYTKDVVG